MNLVLETDRLIMREMRHKDAEALFEMDSNPNVHKYLWNKPFTTIEEIHNYIEMVRSQYERNNIGRFSTILKETGESRDQDNLRKEINQIITEHIGPIAKLDKIQFVSGLPKTRSGKIMRRILRKIAGKDTDNLGDTSTLLNPEVVQEIMDNVL